MLPLYCLALRPRAARHLRHSSPLRILTLRRSPPIPLHHLLLGAHILHGPSLLLHRQLVVRAMAGLRAHIRLARGRDHSAVFDHGLHYPCGEDLCVLADFGPVVVVCVYTGPDEQREVQDQADELACYACELDGLAVRFRAPQGVDVGVLVGAVGEHGRVVRRVRVPAAAAAAAGVAVARRVDVARVLLPDPCVVVREHVVAVARGIHARRNVPVGAPLRDFLVRDERE